MLSDFGGSFLHDPAEVHQIHELDQLRTIVSGCLRQERSMRVRCFAHSMNGMSVPRQNEVLFDMQGVRHVTWRGDGSVAGGGGLSVWGVDQYVRRIGWELAGVNDGGGGAPSGGGLLWGGWD